jgi:hypothetical protein
MDYKAQFLTGSLLNNEIEKKNQLKIKHENRLESIWVNPLSIIPKL